MLLDIGLALTVAIFGYALSLPDIRVFFSMNFRIGIGFLLFALVLFGRLGSTLGGGSSELWTIFSRSLPIFVAGCLQRYRVRSISDDEVAREFSDTVANLKRTLEGLQGLPKSVTSKSRYQNLLGKYLPCTSLKDVLYITERSEEFLSDLLKYISEFKSVLRFASRENERAYRETMRP
jgi:hypothetical protein